MKKYIPRRLAVILTFILVLAMLPVHYENAAAAAAKPSMSISKKTIIGLKANFTLKAQNVGSNVKSMQWYSQNTNIATVTASSDFMSGKVTTVGKGNTYIKCKITYKDKKKVFISCLLSVKIPATSISINNAKDVETGVQEIKVGETYDFSRTLTPSDASDKTFWYIEEKGRECATVDKNGIVKGINSGYATLKVVASFTESSASSSLIYDTVMLHIVDNKVSVKTVDLMNSTKLVVTFSEAIKSSSILDSNNKLTDAIVVAPMIDTKGKTANSLGTLHGSLSSDGMTLTIDSTYAFNGTYGILFTSKVTSVGGTSLTEYNTNLSLNDTTKPKYTGYTVDDSGLIVSLNFSEALDYSEMEVTDAKLVKTTLTVDATTLNMLNTEANYVISDDKKSLVINLSTMKSDDRNKVFSVSISGIKDLSGNTPASNPITATFQTDTSKKSQAKLISIQRTGYTTLTATFSRAIETPGYAILNNGEYIDGVVDSKDRTKVNYTITKTSALITGTKNVTVGAWDGYNTESNSTTSTTISVNFSMESTKPVLTESSLSVRTINNVDTYVINLTYNEDVKAISGNGSLATVLKATDGDIDTIALTYTAESKGKEVQLILVNSQINKTGVYTISLPEGFVQDSYDNKSNTAKFTIDQTGNEGSKLAAPTKIEQSIENPNIIKVYFDTKIDVSSAETVSNYTITGTGTTVTAANVTQNSLNGALVELTLHEGCLTASTKYPISISGVKGYQNSYSPMDTYSITMPLNENVAPEVTNVKYSYPRTITITFSETIKGTPSFQAVQGTTDYYGSSVISNNTVIITLNDTPTLKSKMQIAPASDNILTDNSGNAAEIGTRNITPTT
jgi:hypothetical protein